MSGPVLLVLTATSILLTHVRVRRQAPPREAWWFNLALEVCWVWYAVANCQWWLLAVAGLYSLGYLDNLRRWPQPVPAALRQPELAGVAATSPAPPARSRETKRAGTTAGLGSGGCGGLRGIDTPALAAADLAAVRSLGRVPRVLLAVWAVAAVVGSVGVGPAVHAAYLGDPPDCSSCHGGP